MGHKIFVLFLALLACSALLTIGVHGFSYYATPVHLRPYRPDYEAMRTSGAYSHGLGVLGGAMITIGVLVYSTRKRVRALWTLGRLSVWLEVHIFLCLLGPILVIFHTTFKAGGIAAISLWAMLAVWASGMVGRFLYAQIPRNIEGVELSADAVRRELDHHRSLLDTSPVGREVLAGIDRRFSSIVPPETLRDVLAALIHLESIRRDVRRSVGALIARTRIDRAQAADVRRIALARAALLQKSMIMTQTGRLFHYWHAIHLPFTIIMFITLAVHIAVSVLLGYRWIF